MRVQLFAIATAGLLFILPAHAQEDDTRRTINAIKARLVQVPDDPTLTYYLAGYQARAGDKADALANLKRLADIGDGFLPVGMIGFEAIWGDATFKEAFALLEKKLPRVADAKLAFELADRRLVPEGIAHDSVSGDFFVGSIAQKSIVRVQSDGKGSAYSKADDGLHSILSIAVDASQRRLYAVSTNALTEAGRKQLVNEIVVYDLKSGRKLGATAVPKAEQLNDVAVAPNGDVYATDSAAGMVWRIAAGQLEEFLPRGQARGTNGLAVSGDGKTLYVAHSTGVVRIDTATKKMERMPPPKREGVAGIDGLYWHRGDLLGVQNVTNPARVIRLRLSADGRDITAVETLQSHHHPAFDEPTTGAVVDNSFYVLATTQVGRYNEKGVIVKPETMKAPKVLKIPLG